MAKVVGKDEKHVHRVTCEKCASIIEYVLKEVETRHYSCMGASSGDEVLTCPERSETIVLRSW